MIQDAKNPIQFGEKLTREFADPTIFLNLQPSLYSVEIDRISSQTFL